MLLFYSICSRVRNKTGPEIDLSFGSVDLLSGPPTFAHMSHYEIDVELISAYPSAAYVKGFVDGW